MSNPKPDFFTVIKTQAFHRLRSIEGTFVLTVNAAQIKAESHFSQIFSKTQLLSFFQNIYNSIKFNNQNSLNVKERKESY